MNIPYGNSNINFDINHKNALVFTPGSEFHPSCDEYTVLKNAINAYLDKKNIHIDEKTSIAVGINDQSRPIPHQLILPALLEFLINQGAKPENITFFIATGTHKPVAIDLFPLIVSKDLIEKYKIISHDCDDTENLKNIGITTRNTPVFVNKSFYESDLKIVVGNIESHHFMGFSGGYKTASIGLTSRATITGNHDLLPHPNAKMGLFSTNPMRQEVEEIGRMIGLDLAFNVVINHSKKILAAFFGKPEEVIREGIDFIRHNIQIDLGNVLHKFDLVIASAGGYPKDINFYQAQKALTHACLFAKPGGKIILAAECRDSFGSDKFHNYLKNHKTPVDVIRAFESDNFEIGPHKAYQLAKQTLDHEITLVSKMGEEDVNTLKVNYAPDLQSAVNQAISALNDESRIAVLPYATNTMPIILE